MFAPILANTAEVEAEVNPELAQAKQTIRKLWSDLEAAEGRIGAAQVRADAAEQRFVATGGLSVQLFVQKKRQPIQAAVEHWLELPAFSIAIISDSPGYVSEVLKAGNGR